MSSKTLIPSSTITMGGASAVEGSTGFVTTGPVAHNYLGDNLTSTYVILQGSHTGIGFPNPSLPAGANIRAVFSQIVTSGEATDGGSVLGSQTLRNNIPDIPGAQDMVVTWDAPLSSISYTKANPTGITDWEFDLKKQAGNDELRIHGLRLVVSYITRPVVSVTNPTGTISNTSFPQVQWDVTSQDPDGGEINVAEVRVYNSATYSAAGFNPWGSATPSAESGRLTGLPVDLGRWRVDTKLTNTTYRAYVRVAQDGLSQWSANAFSQFTVSVTPPADPTVTVTAESAQGRMKIRVQGGVGTPSVDAIDIQRSIDGGATWKSIRPLGSPDSGVGIDPIGGEVVAYDFEMPMDIPIRYRARTLHNYFFGEVAASSWVQGAPATWTSTFWWVKHPANWTLNRTVPVRDQPSYTRAARQGILTPLSREDPVVISDRRIKANGEITFKLLTKTEQIEVDALVDSAVPLLIQAPTTHNWDDRWVSFGDQTRARVVEQGARTWMFDTFAWQEVRSPSGGLLSMPSDIGGPTGLIIPFVLNSSATL